MAQSTSTGTTYRQVNAQGAGVYSMINAGDGVWRSNDNVTEITNCLLDLDGSPLDPVLTKPRASRMPSLKRAPDITRSGGRFSP